MFKKNFSQIFKEAVNFGCFFCFCHSLIVQFYKWECMNKNAQNSFLFVVLIRV